MFRLILSLVLLSTSAEAQNSTFIKGPSLYESTTKVTSAAGTTTLTCGSNENYEVTGSSTQTIVLPDATLCSIGKTFYILNSSTGNVTLNTNGGSLLKTFTPNMSAKVLLHSNGTAAGTWKVSAAVYPVDLTKDVTGILPTANGGTNQSTWTLGSIPFIGTAGTIFSQDNNALFWDNTNKRLGINVAGTTPGAPIDVHNTSNLTAQFNNVGVQGASAGALLNVVSDPGAAMSSGSRLGSMNFGGAYDNTSTISNSAGFAAFATENWSSTAKGTKLVLSVTPNTTSGIQTALTIDQDKSATFTGALSAPSLTLTTTPLAVSSGGTGASTLTNHGVLIGQGTSAVSATTAGTAGQALVSGGAGADPTWTTSTFPTTSTAPCSLVANTSNTVTCLAATTGNRLLKTNGTTLSFSQADLTTDVTGALPIGNGGTGQTTKAAAFDALSPMTSSGDIIYGGASGTGTRLAKGTDGQVLTLASGVPSWAAGMLNPMTTAGDIIYGGASGTPTRRAIGSTGDALIVSGGVPVWTPPATFGEVQLDNMAGYGSTATKIPYYTTSTVSNGNSIFTVSNDSTNGAKVTFSKAAMVTTCASLLAAAGSQIGISNNGSVTTNVYSLTKSQRKGYAQIIVNGASTYANQGCASFPVAVNDVVRPHGDGSACGDTGSCSWWLTAMALAP